jgi:L-ribulose-5-phosphate 3-epimerase
VSEAYGAAVKLGVMQGRLVPPEPKRFQSFPRQRWREEFALAAAAGLETIEWIYDAYGEDVNPLGTDAGVKEMQALSAAHCVGVESVCADWFMDFPVLRVDGDEALHRWQRLRWLMERCAKLSINRIVLPFVDASSIQTSADGEQVVAGIRTVIDIIDQLDVEIHLETSLAPAAFALLLSDIGHPRVKVNYDSGNSASLGFKPAEEFAQYGSHIGSVHIKDRQFGGGTVPLGQGDADFNDLFSALEATNYRRDFILQVARGVEGEELEWVGENAKTARTLINQLQTT